VANFTLWLRGGYVGETDDVNSALTAASIAAHSTGAACTIVDEEDGPNGSLRYVVEADGSVEPLGLQVRS
jgi:hypothetical protein